ncbi:MAG: VOC family protein [Ectothiorhodospiraceae bacterium]|nr:VOC family protein [Ectothiorhodospiraceae bacterium]
MPKANVYLTFDGNCEEAFDFYKSVLGGEYPYVGRFKDMPPQEGMPPIPDEMANRIMHISLPIGEDSILMGSDTGGEGAPDLVQGNNFSISVDADSKEDADRLFSGLSAGGNVTMPMADTFWGSYFGMCTDKFGINWMVSYSQPQE